MSCHYYGDATDKDKKSTIDSLTHFGGCRHCKSWIVIVILTEFVVSGRKDTIVCKAQSVSIWSGLEIINQWEPKMQKQNFTFEQQFFLEHAIDPQAAHTEPIAPDLCLDDMIVGSQAGFFLYVLIYLFNESDKYDRFVANMKLTFAR